MPAKAAAPAPMKAARRDPFKHLSADELRLAKLWYTEDDMEPSEIAALLRRDKSTMTRLLVMEKERKTQGRPPLLDEVAVDKLVALLDHMVVEADGQHEVTVDMLRGRARSRASNRTISDALHARKLYFRGLREKPVLTDADTQARHTFAKQRVHKTELGRHRFTRASVAAAAASAGWPGLTSTSSGSTRQACLSSTAHVAQGTAEFVRWPRFTRKGPSRLVLGSRRSACSLVCFGRVGGSFASNPARSLAHHAARLSPGVRPGVGWCARLLGCRGVALT